MKRSREDYLRLIYDFYEDGARSVDLAHSLKVSKASVSEMIKKLASEGLVKQEKYSKVFLTVKGKKHAEKMYNKHFVVKKFVEKFFGHEKELVEKEAHELEHALSDQSVGVISKMLNMEKISVKPGYVG